MDFPGDADHPADRIGRHCLGTPRPASRRSVETALSASPMTILIQRVCLPDPRLCQDRCRRYAPADRPSRMARSSRQ
jgi:hypothetical protein